MSYLLRTTCEKFILLVLVLLDSTSQFQVYKLVPMFYYLNQFNIKSETISILWKRLLGLQATNQSADQTFSIEYAIYESGIIT